MSARRAVKRIGATRGVAEAGGSAGRTVSGLQGSSPARRVIERRLKMTE